MKLQLCVIYSQRSWLVGERIEQNQTWLGRLCFGLVQKLVQFRAVQLKERPKTVLIVGSTEVDGGGLSSRGCGVDSGGRVERRCSLQLWGICLWSINHNWTRSRQRFIRLFAWRTREHALIWPEDIVELGADGVEGRLVERTASQTKSLWCASEDNFLGGIHIRVALYVGVAVVCCACCTN